MIVQGSPEWKALRCGKVTASRIADIMAKTKSGYSTSRANYMAELICERLTGQPAEQYTNSAMAWGTEKEPEARKEYESYYLTTVEQIAFVTHPTIDGSGASPDGLVGADGLIEIKAPNTSTHLETLLGQAVPSKYELQMLFQMACTGRQWCDFVSFDPRLPGNMRLFIKRLPRDDKRIQEIEAEVTRFLAELDAKVDQLQEMFGEREAAE